MTPRDRPATLWVLAGEASGDSHAAAVVRALRRIRPDVRVVAYGGGALAAAGAEVRLPLAAHAVTGVFEVARGISVFRRALSDFAREAAAGSFDLLLAVDFPDFNLRAAAAARRAGIPVHYYIVPQVWAWRSGRAKALSELADRISVIFPFEVECFARHGGRVEYVGHPLAEAPAPDLARVPGRPPRLGLFPGSRANERARLSPVFVGAARRIPDLVPVLSVPEGTEGGADRPPDIPEYRGPARDLLAASEAALVKTGTVSLEAVYYGVPAVAAYRLAAGSWWIAKRLVRVESAAMANILLGRKVVPEYLQGAARPEALAAAVASVAARREVFRAAAEELRAVLGPSRPSERVAAALAEALPAA